MKRVASSSELVVCRAKMEEESVGHYVNRL